MFKFIAENWDKLLGFLIATIGIWRYLDSRSRELKWKRTELLFSQAAFLDTNPDICNVVKIIEGRNKDIGIDDLFDDSGRPDNAQYGEVWQQIDKLLNLLDRIAYAVIHLKTLTRDEAMNFSWYLRLLEKNKNMAKYCEEQGFGDILELAKRIKT